MLLRRFLIFKQVLEPSVPLLVDTSGMYVRREGDPSRGLYLCGGMESMHTDDSDCVGTQNELIVDHDLWMNHMWPGKYFKSERRACNRVYGKHRRLTFLFLLPPSNLFQWLCHVLLYSKTPKQVFF